MKVIKGDIISMVQNGDFDVLVHGCNCFNNMNLGFAKKIKKNFQYHLSLMKDQDMVKNTN